MNVKIGTEATQFLFWEHLFRILGILSLQCMLSLPMMVWQTGAAYLFGRDLGAGEALDDDVVSVVADDDHGHDGESAEDSSQKAVQMAS